MTESIQINPSGPIRGAITPPGSKSITNRALICAALADGVSTLRGALDSDDTQVMIESLGRLGVEVECDWKSNSLVVHGCAGEIPKSNVELFVGNSGTTIRFLTALCCLGRGKYRLSGVPRMHERPIGPMIDALKRLGVSITAENGLCPPVLIEADGLPGGSVKVAADISSQYASGILMALPYADQFSVMQLTEPVISKPYIDMTCAVMCKFGVNVIRLDDFHEYSLDANQTFDAIEYDIEPDASAASYFWAAAAITGGSILVKGLSDDSIQGDVRFTQLLKKMGCTVIHLADGIKVNGPAKVGIDVDMSDISDTAQTLAIVSLFVEGPTRIRGVAHNRVKETDRIGNLATELRKLGAEVIEHADGLEIRPPAFSNSVAIDTYDDHRMAMSFALAGLKQPGIAINNPSCVSKTYPDFFDDLQRLAETSS